MPITSSAVKKMRQDAKKTVRNNRTKVNMKQAIRSFTDAVKENKDAKALNELLSKSYKTIDMTAKKNLIHTKNASRKKAGLAKMMPKAK